MRKIDQVIGRWGWLGPPMVLGLYVGRVLSELFQPGLIGAVAVSIAAMGLSIFGLRGQPVKRTWPLLFLFLYVVYPDADVSAALSAAALTLVIGALSYVSKKESSSGLFSRLPLIAAIMLAVGFLVLYVATLSPGLLPADSGEFQLVGATLGVAHPPGFPLYTLLANLMTRLPFGLTPATMVNALSVITGTMTLLLTYYTVFRLTSSVIGGLVSAIALGTATTFWAQSTTANVRSLTALFAALAIYLLIRYREEKGKENELELERESERSELRPSSKVLWLLLIAFVLVLTLGITHHTSLIFMGLIFIFYLFLIDRNWIKQPRLWPWLLLAIFTGLLPLLYLPLRAAAGAQGAPADLTTIKGFLNHVLALGFRGDFFYFTEPGILWDRLKVMANVMTFQFNTLILIVMGIGFLLLIWRDRKLAFLLGGSFAIMALITAMYRAPQTIEYLMPAYVPLAILLGYAVGYLHNNLRADRDAKSISTRYGAVSSIFVGIAALVVIVQGVERLPSFAYLLENGRTREFTETILEEAPVDSVILTDWHWVTPLWYLQEVEGKRPDVEVSFVYPTAEEYEATWARRIQEELVAGRPVLATHFDQDAYTSLPPADPVDDAFLFGDRPSYELPDGFDPLDIHFGETIQILGYLVDDRVAEVGREFRLTLAWRPITTSGEGFTLFAHLIGDDGKVYAQEDVPTRAKEEGITFTQFRLTPRPGTEPSEYALMIGAYGVDPLVDARGETRTQISTLQVVAASTPMVTFNPTSKIGTGENDRTLIGYDWDNTIPGNPRLYLHWQGSEGFPSETFDPVDNEFALESIVGPWGVERTGIKLKNDGDQRFIPFGQGIVWSGRPFQDVSASPGQTLNLPQMFFSAHPIDRDLVVSVRLVGYEEDGYHWSWWDLDDGIPAMGAIPTLKWIGGSVVRDPHWLTVDEDVPPGQVVSPLLRLYDAFTGRTLPILDERISEETPWLPIGLGKVAE
ncbi:MAG: DUF2723 domain-containing protein [Candidatus Promineifilaceae bacterium]